MQKRVKSALWAGAVLALACSVPSARAATSVGVSVQVSQPGVYGRVDIGQFPQPQVVVQQPIVIQAAPRYQRPEPVYLWVPPGHQKNWRRHCGQYHACGVPVYFVQDRWYQENVMHGQARGGRDNGRREERHDGDRYKDERRDNEGQQRHDQGHGHGRGRD